MGEVIQAYLVSTVVKRQNHALAHEIPIEENFMHIFRKKATGVVVSHSVTVGK